MNRIASYLEESPEEELGDYYVVAGEFGCAWVAPETAARLESVLERWWLPRWVVFRDRAGSRIRVRPRDIRLIGESTTSTRAADRRLDRARRREEKEDRRPWEDDD